MAEAGGPRLRPVARVAIFAAYCAAASALVLVFADDRGAWPVAGLALLSVALGRLLPGLGFAAPLVLAAGWLGVVLASTPPGFGRGLAVVYLLIALPLAEAGVLVGAASAAWSWTARGLRERA